MMTSIVEVQRYLSFSAKKTVGFVLVLFDSFEGFDKNPKIGSKKVLKKFMSNFDINMVQRGFMVQSVKQPL